MVFVYNKAEPPYYNKTDPPYCKPLKAPQIQEGRERAVITGHGKGHGRGGGPSRAPRSWSREQPGARAQLGHSPPLACICGISSLYFTGNPPHILGIPLYPSLYLAMSSHVAADPLYPAVSHCIQLYVSSCTCCIPLYLTISHRLENGIWPIYTPGEGSQRHVGPLITLHCGFSTVQ